MSTPANSRPNSISRTRIGELRKLVDDARAAGLDVEGLVLNVSQRDESLIKRSKDVETAELSFADGETRFLGVKLGRSETAQSWLEKAASA